ncbi:RHS repeat-associated core domain-containing protein [Bacillus sp. FJAT-52991]|uniref:RHS repeat-associated core domain-containing protein n=1 Tax=Bacillus kandeliae TaxID=3129297 RepID=A0ABZ2N4J9_9BACI
MAKYIYDDSGRPLTMTRDGKTYYYVLNEHKDVVALTDASGNTVASYTYDAWGNILSKSGAMADVNPYRYASYRHDNETGLYYLLARYYEPKEGIFLTIDPQPGEVNDPLSQHPYVYVQNNPVMLDDPDGENPYVAVLVYVGGRYVIKYVAKKGAKYAAKKAKGKKKKKAKKKSKKQLKLNLQFFGGKSKKKGKEFRGGKKKIGISGTVITIKASKIGGIDEVNESLEEMILIMPERRERRTNIGLALANQK